MSGLCHSFLQIADRVWREIDEADRAGLSYGEETITETILLELNRNHSVNVRIRAFSKQVEEPKNGSDWEWWIGRPGSWLGMRIQAKKVKLPNELFHRLQTYETKSMPDTQINTLIKVAAQDKLNPAYCLYVHSRKVAPLWRNGARCSAPSMSRNQYGCLIADALAAKSTGSNKLADLAHVSFPWHCLACDCAGSSDDGGTLAENAVAALKQSREMSGERGFGMLEIDRQIFEPVQELPEYMHGLVEGPDDGERDGILFGRAIERRLKGFVLLQEGE